MTTVIVNGHEYETGCVLAGHWGRHNHARMVLEAEGLGFPLDDEDRQTLDEYDRNDWDPQTQWHAEAVATMMDEAERWLNERTAARCAHCGLVVWHNDARWVHDGTPLDDPTVCEDGTSLTDEMVLSFVWHWRDGEFFLSPLCENGDCDDDTCAHWD